MRHFAIGLALLLLSLPAQAQTLDICTVSPCLIQANKPFEAKADHDGLETTSYRLYVNGAILQTLSVNALQSGVITFAVNGLQRGTYVIYVEAIGDGGATSGSELTLNVVPGKPKAPANTRTVQAR